MDYILNKNITIVDKERKKHSKASEEYVHVRFDYPDATWDGWVPVEYRRTGIFIKQGEVDRLTAYLNKVYEQMNPINFQSWLKKQEKQLLRLTKKLREQLQELTKKLIRLKKPRKLINLFHKKKSTQC